jgi:hypothetical protein
LRTASATSPQALAAQDRIQFFDPQLIREAADVGEFFEEPLVADQLLLEPLDERPKALHLSALFDDSSPHEAVLRNRRLGQLISARPRPLHAGRC